MVKMTKLIKIACVSIILTSITIGKLWAETIIPCSPMPGSKVYRKMMSWREIRDKGIVKQKYDYSCGSGALATLMNIGFGEKVSEGDIIELILKDKYPFEIEVIETSGYSLLELKNVAEKMGYITAMRTLQIKHLYQLKAPVIVYYEPEGQKHFAVLKAAVGDRVYIADPARGNIRMSIFRFQNEWPGIILAIDKKNKKHNIKGKLINNVDK